jgi:hypothetical protein
LLRDTFGKRAFAGGGVTVDGHDEVWNLHVRDE